MAVFVFSNFSLLFFSCRRRRSWF